MRILKFLFLLPAALLAHFSFVVPQPGGQSARLILNETLTGNPDVGVKILAGAQLKLRDASGRDEDLTLQPSGHDDHWLLSLPGSGPRIVHGTANLGLSPGRGTGPQAKPYLLLYYTKAILGKQRGPQATIGGPHVIELTPTGEPGQIFIQCNVQGQPRPDAEINVLLPDGTTTKAKTNAAGLAGPFPQSGRFGAWARYWEDRTGEHNGKSYQQVRHYGMLVFDAYAPLPQPTRLPEATSSFGAALQGQHLYIYGGHVANTHNYDTKAVSGLFQRFDVQKQTWETLPAGPALQGLNLVADQQHIYRVGGMAPRNLPGTKADIHSVADVARFDSSRRIWEALPPLPEARSSHDVVIVDQQLYVLGGWQLRGSEPATWPQHAYRLDLRDPQATWQQIPQPFSRRALIATVHQGKIYILGGIQPSSAVSTDVDIFDPQSQTWSKGPAIPGSAIQGFAPAAATHGGALYLSVGDGSLLRLNSKSQCWEQVSESSPRLAHRMLSSQGQLWILGGAHKGRNLDLVEAVSPQ